MNGASCLDGIETFTCICTDGWKGQNCTQSKYHLAICYFVFCDKKVVRLFLYKPNSVNIHGVMGEESKATSPCFVKCLMDNLFLLCLAQYYDRK